MLFQLSTLYKKYHPQFWLMVFGIFLSTFGAGLIGPFLMIYTSEKLGLPLSTVVSLITINAGTGLFSSFIAGTLTDKIGRKIVMVFSLAANGLIYLLLMRANTFAGFAILMFLTGLVNPLYQVGADAMLADLIPKENRNDAYAINRILNNAGFAFGPAIGGFLAAISYNYAFLGAAAGMLSYSLLLLIFARETLAKSTDHKLFSDHDDGYTLIFKDKNYLKFVLILGIGLIAPGMLWVLLAVYAKTNFGMSENMYGWIPTTNAVLCVFAQYFVTKITRRYRPMWIVSIGMLIYAIGVGSVALMSNFWGFWLSMVIMTFGELTLVPTASTYVANISPSTLRGRYMSIYWLAWGISRSGAPLLGGWLNDNVSPRSIWIGGLFIGLASSLGILFLSSKSQKSAF
ncbi:MAG: MFS transporter [Chloroflexota bacterium]